MRSARGFQAACLALGLAFLGTTCTGAPQDASGNGVRGGTLRVLSFEIPDGLDTAAVYNPTSLAIARSYARTLYGYNLAGPPEQVTDPVPDIASGPPQLSADRRTYTFTLRPGVRYAPPVNREVTAQDFITAIRRLYDIDSAGQQYANLIAGATAFGARKASGISGLAAPDVRTLKITLVQPAPDLLSILTLPLFAPVPGEYAAHY
jgi:peptide/nickel transport system substrate-binding protein